MTDMFLERRFDPPLTGETVFDMALESKDCFDRHRVEWRKSKLSIDGSRMICWFRAPDMESARIAMRESDADMSVFWAGTVHDRPGIEAAAITRANVLVERTFARATSLQEIQDIEDAGIHCLDVRNVSFVRTFHSKDQQRMICLYNAPDAESVRVAQREAGVPFDDAWSFRLLEPHSSS